MIESTVEFVAGLSTGQIIAYFWPFFLIDVTRYVLLDLYVLVKHMPKQYLTRHKSIAARKALYREKPLISILVPGKNEGKHIPKLVQSLKQQSYKNYELIIVDDGSDDDTAAICRPLAKKGDIDVFIRNEIRGGKASAANTALNFSKGKYIIHLDADSHLNFDAIEKILLPFYLDDNVGAVGGDIRVANIKASIATHLQAVEYIKSLSTSRTVSSDLGILRIISGAFGAFRRDVLNQIYGWDVGPGLDGDITLKIRKMGYRVVHEHTAVCYTNVPVTFKKLAKQRFRWDKSMVRFRLRKHNDILLPSAEFRLNNFIASADNIFFNLILNVRWWIYFIQILIFTPHILGFIFIINYILYFILNIVQFCIALVLLKKSLRKSDFNLFVFLPLMPLYTGIYLRIVRTFSYIMELFHYSSYFDPWNPWKVSKVAKREKL